MAEQNSPQEQSMEEILASIRRIISENSDAEQTGKKSNSKGYDENRIKPEISVTKGEGVKENKNTQDDEILELTDEVQADGTVINLKTGRQLSEDEDDDNSAEVAETLNNTTQETIETAIEPEASDSEDAPADDRLISSNLGLECVASLSALAEAVDDYRDAVDESFGPKTMENMVKEIIKPMVKEWLDANLPQTVEQLVGREIERIARETEDLRLVGKEIKRLTKEAKDLSKS